MTSLRLAEAFTRAASPEGHDVRTLHELRDHMHGVHGLEAAPVLPQRVLMHLHDEDHATREPRWSGSGDASSNPGFIASLGESMFRRRHASYADHLRPPDYASGPGWTHGLQDGDVITGAEQHSRLVAMRDHMKSLGFPVKDTDKDGYEQIGPQFTIPDTGHSVSIGHSRADQTWSATVHHPDDVAASGEKTIARVNLGLNADHVPHLLTREMGSQPLIGEMRNQWARAAHREQYGPRPATGWRGPDKKLIRPKGVSFTARGAQLPRDEEDDGYR